MKEELKEELKENYNLLKILLLIISGEDASESKLSKTKKGDF